MINKSYSALQSSNFVHHWYDNRPNWTPLSPIPILIVNNINSNNNNSKVIIIIIILIITHVIIVVAVIIIMIIRMIVSTCNNNNNNYNNIAVNLCFSLNLLSKNQPMAHKIPVPGKRLLFDKVEMNHMILFTSDK